MEKMEKLLWNHIPKHPNVLPPIPSHIDRALQAQVGIACEARGTHFLG